MQAMIEKPGQSPEPAGETETRKRIVIIDDDPAIRQLLMRLLHEEGYWAETAASGAEALEMIKTSVDLALLDLQMPGQDGWETFEQLSCNYPGLPVILITARPNQFFPALATGVDALLEKPLDFEKLLDTIRSLLAESPEARQARLTHCPALFPFTPPGHDGAGQPAG